MNLIPGTKDTYLVGKADIPAAGALLRQALQESETVEFRARAHKETRSSIQNARMWAMLDDVSKQVTWYGKKLTDYEWKDIFSAALKKQEVVPGIDGGFVVLGQRTSRMSIKEMSDLITLMLAFGADKAHLVYWTDPKAPTWDQIAGRAA